VTRREQEARKRRRLRREALEKAEREFAVGRPLVDLHAPVLGGGNDAEHFERVREAMERRIHDAAYEVGCLMTYFARKCWLPKAEADRMPRDLTALLLKVGPMRVPPTHSTAIPNPHSDHRPTTIPRLELKDGMDL
jgi:hypothetical protein